jgi:hypothetical protein
MPQARIERLLNGIRRMGFRYSDESDFIRLAPGPLARGMNPLKNPFQIFADLGAHRRGETGKWLADL